MITDPSTSAAEIPTKEPSKHRILKALAPLAIGVGTVLLVSPQAADAAVGQTKSIPSFHATGSISYTRTYGGTARWNDRAGGHCTYIEAAYVAVLGLDSGWSRLTRNDCRGDAETMDFHRPTSRPFNGMKFRLCEDVPNRFDPCGSSVTIYN